MNLNTQTIQNIVVVGGFIGAAWIYRRGHVPQQTIRNLEESNKSYVALDAARQVSITNLEVRITGIIKNHAEEVLMLNRAIADLQGQIKVYKELPLRELADIQQKILDTLHSSATILAKDTSDAAKHVEEVKTDLIHKAPLEVVSK